MKKFHNDYKYDIAITMPIYKIGKERIKTYLQEIKDTFDGYSYQIVLSDNRPLERRDCDLSEFDDDVVSHVDCGTENVYTFKARRSAFYATNAYFIWCIDDDNNMTPEGRYVLLNLLSQNDTIESDKYEGSLGVNWLLSSNVKKFYDSITTERLPKICFEDMLVQYFTAKIIKEKKYKPELLKIYIPRSEAWIKCGNDEDNKKSKIDINNFVNGIESMIDFSRTHNIEHFAYFCALANLRSFKFSNEDIDNLLNYSDEINDFFSVLDEKIIQYNLYNNSWLLSPTSDKIIKKFTNMKKFHNDYKYDIAITMPIYKIGKERIKTYLQEIKDTFDGYSYQIVLSDNRPLERRDCDLSEFDDDVVSHVDNGGNVYAFKARRSAFYATNAYFIWCIDDDNNMTPEGRYVLLNLLSQNDTIESDREFGTLGVNWLLSSNVKKFYDSITTERLPTLHFEDVILKFFTADKTKLIYKPELLKIYIPRSEAWNDFYSDAEDEKKPHSEIKHFIQGIESMIDFKIDENKIYDLVALFLCLFKFSNEDIDNLLNYSDEINDFFSVLDEKIIQYEMYKTIPKNKKIPLYCKNIMRIVKKFPKKFHNDYKYDIAITMPIYKIGKERIKTYLQEIKDTFDGYSYQIVLSDNRPLERRDCDLSEFDDDVVSHVDNGGNVYAFKARRSAFYATNAYFIWCIDDDNNMTPEGRYVLLNLLSQNDTIMVEKNDYGGCLGKIWLLSSNVKKFYDSITTERLPITYCEDNLLSYEAYRQTHPKRYITTSLEKIYIHDSETWCGSEHYDYDYDYKYNINISLFIEAIKSLSDFVINKETEMFLYFQILLLLRFFKFTANDFNKLVNDSSEVTKVLINLKKIITSNVSLGDYIFLREQYTKSINCNILLSKLEKQSQTLRVVKGLLHATALAEFADLEDKIICLDDESYNFLQNVGFTNVNRREEFVNVYHSKVYYLMIESINNPNTNIIFMDACTKLKNNNFINNFDGIIYSNYNGDVTTKFLVAKNCSIEMLHNYSKEANKKRQYKPDVYYYFKNCKNHGKPEQFLKEQNYCKNVNNFADNFDNMQYGYIELYDNILFNNKKLNLKYYDYIKQIILEEPKKEPNIINIINRINRIQTLRVVKGLLHATALAEFADLEDKIICLDDESYNFLQNVGFTNVNRREEFVNVYHSKVYYLMIESINNPNTNIIFMDALIKLRSIQLYYTYTLEMNEFKGIICPAYYQVYNVNYNVPIAKILIANNCSIEMLNDYKEQALQQREHRYRYVDMKYYDEKIGNNGTEEQLLASAYYCTFGDDIWCSLLGIFGNVRRSHLTLFDNILLDNKLLNLKYYDYIKDYSKTEAYEHASDKIKKSLAQNGTIIT